MTTATVLDIEIVFNFSRGSDESTSIDESINATDSSLQSTVDNRAEELLDELNAELDDDEEAWEYDGYSVDGFDEDWADPGEFDDLDEYGAYAEKVEEYGFAYHARYEDVGDFDFDDSYNGEWVLPKNSFRTLLTTVTVLSFLRSFTLIGNGALVTL